MLEGVRAVRELAPKAFLFENVDGLLHAKHSDYVAHLLGKFSRLGYVTEIHRINARDYGIAQNRARIMIVGLRKDLAGSFRMPPRFPEMATNMGDVLADLMGANGWSGAEAWVQSMRERPFIERGRVVQQGFLSDTIRTYQGVAQELERKRAGRNGVSYAPPAKAAPTEDQARREGFVPGLTNRMRARLQNFDDDWEFSGGLQVVATQIGNAVPVGVAKAMGLAMHSTLKGVGWDWAAMMTSGTERAREAVRPPPIDGSGNAPLMKGELTL
jgi:DNA (cytosine-5)-methyltransferase 1